MNNILILLHVFHVLLLSALLDQFTDRHEGLLETKSLQGTAGLNLPQPVIVTGQIQLSGDLVGWGGGSERWRKKKVVRRSFRCKCLCLLAWKLFPHYLTEMCPPSLIQVWDLYYFIKNIPITFRTPFSKKSLPRQQHCHIKETTDHTAAADLTFQVLVHLSFEVEIISFTWRTWNFSSFYLRSWIFLGGVGCVSYLSYGHGVW